MRESQEVPVRVSKSCVVEFFFAALVALFPPDFKSPNPNLFLYLFVGPNGDLDLEIHVSKRAFLYLHF